MASCAHLETPPAVLAGLERLRNLSRLVLAAIERDDLDEIERLARQSGDIVDAVAPQCEGRAASPALPEGAADILREIGGMNRAIVGRLTERRDEAARELSEIRGVHGRLRAVKLPSVAGPSIVDRAT